MQELFGVLEEAAGRGRVWKDEPMRKHTSFRIGGPADLFVAPESEEGIRRVLAACRTASVPLHIVGNGSNLLVSDRGIRGVVLQIFRNYSDISADKDRLIAKSGALLSVLSKQALARGLSGLEFASGIPGTLGGAVVMNAGAYGGEMKDVLEWVRAMTPDGETVTLGADELGLGYRTSVIPGRGLLVLEACLRLEHKDPEQIRRRMEELREQRVQKQPLDLPSAGSTFKRPEGYFAGKLIMDTGLRGISCGGAQVSEKHCGFVVNRGGATAADVRSLIRRIQGAVWDAYGVMLEPEVRMVGEFEDE